MDVGLTDKDLHCIIRHLQDSVTERNDACLFCKYAIQCSKDHSDIWEFIDAGKKLAKLTGAHEPITCGFSRPPKEWDGNSLCEGSWFDDMPELKAKIKGMSLTEKEKFIQSEKIWDYLPDSERP